MPNWPQLLHVLSLVLAGAAASLAFLGYSMAAGVCAILIGTANAIGIYLAPPAPTPPPPGATL